MAKPIDTEKYYQIYADYHIRKLSYEEIVKVRKVSPGTVRNALTWVDEKIENITQPELLKGVVESTRDRLMWLKEQARDSLRRIKMAEGIGEGVAAQSGQVVQVFAVLAAAIQFPLRPPSPVWLRVTEGLAWLSIVATGGSEEDGREGEEDEERELSHG